MWQRPKSARVAARRRPDDDSRWGMSTGTESVPDPRAKRRLGGSPVRWLGATLSIAVAQIGRSTYSGKTGIMIRSSLDRL
jgi:hypothetical protein